MGPSILKCHTGCTNYRKSSLTKHVNSKHHERCVAATKAGEEAPGESDATKMLTKMNAQQMQKMGYLFRNAHALGKHGRPYTDFTWMCNLDRIKGLPIGDTYHTDKKAQEFVHYIAEVERLKLRDLVKEPGFLSIITDGSTASSVTEQEIMYIRVGQKGTVTSSLLSIEPVEKADATGITNAITHAIKKELGEDLFPDVTAKLVALGSDDAAVMIGKHNGVVRKMQDNLQKHMIGVHCMAHRLELAFKKASKDNRVASKVDSLLLSLYLFYHGSNLNRSNLKNAFKVHGQTPLIPTRVGGTRWIPHTNRAVSHLLRGYKAIITHLEQVTNLLIYLFYQFIYIPNFWLLKFRTGNKSVNMFILSVYLYT